MAAILRLAKSRPFAFGMGYSLFKTSGCDLMVQKVVEKVVECPVVPAAEAPPGIRPEDMVHHGVHCDVCGVKPITGPRLK